ncbi:hypothetical protein U1Q18_014966, partial [Sarracenia purpurea var. burkii]
MGGKDGVVVGIVGVETGGGQRSIDRNCPVSLVRSRGKASAEFEEGGNFQRKRISEQARNVLKKIRQLQLEVQKLQYVLVKLEDEKKSKRKRHFFQEQNNLCP